MHAEIQPRLPYVGVAAVRDTLHVRSLAAVSSHLTRQVLACGVQVSGKTLRGEAHNRPGIYPTLSALQELGQVALETAGLEFHIHLSAKPNEDLLSMLKQISELVGQWHDGLQLNMAFPSLPALFWWRSKYPDQRLILSANNACLAQANNDRDQLYQLFSPYDGMVTDLLFDLSGGRGQPLDVSRALPYLDIFATRWPELRLGVAGGLSPINMSAIAELIRIGFWPLNWDAESQLCFPNDHRLDVSRAEQFVAVSSRLPQWCGI